ncbi:SAM-dependent methyltransferase [Nonomuraea sp. SYSU D8015]|uniref:SAM-dependent methyltransferase n=1 Tax=Nonomuraea sp. SYSU D8015 TaxID=2593644 RepID=UPI0016606AFB|nr:SAM-dependent methyltransferase [Nonomuraea sp. SYSU D8015]
MSEPAWIVGVDPNKASAARMYDYVLGGDDNLKIDRDAVARIEALVKYYRPAIHANRDFLRRTVRFLVEQGIRQFIDVGAGLPTRGNVHEVAETSKVVYVDNDPYVIPHARVLMAGSDRVRIVEGDARRPADILAHPYVRDFLDWQEPVALLMISVLHFIPDDANDTAYAAVNHFKSALPPGSYLAIAHGTAEGFRADHNDHVNRQYETAQNQPFMRPYADIKRFFDGCELVDPGLVEVLHWRPDSDDANRYPVDRVGVYGGVAKIMAGGSPTA